MYTLRVADSESKQKGKAKSRMNDWISVDSVIFFREITSSTLSNDYDLICPTNTNIHCHGYLEHNIIRSNE
jgi:hypothetical protein